MQKETGWVKNKVSALCPNTKGSYNLQNFSNITNLNQLMIYTPKEQEIITNLGRVSVQGVKSLGGHFACYAGGLIFMK